MKISKVLTRTFISIVVVAALLLELCWNAVFLGVSWLFVSWTTPYSVVGTWISTHVQYDLDWIEDQDALLDVVVRYGFPDYYQEGTELSICYEVWHTWPFDDSVQALKIVKRDGELHCEFVHGRTLREFYFLERKSDLVGRTSIWAISLFDGAVEQSDGTLILYMQEQPPYEDEFWIRISLDEDSRITHVEILRSYPES